MYNDSNIFILNFGVYGGPPVNARYVVCGSGATQAAAILWPVPVSALLSSMAIRMRAAPGGVVVDTYTIYRAGAATTGIATVTGAAVTAAWSGALEFVANESVGVYFTTSGATAAADVQITLVFRRQV